MDELESPKNENQQGRVFAEGYATHTVMAGECFDSIASEKGYLPKALWNLKENARLRNNRASRNILLPGDTVAFREHQAGKTVKTEAKHCFELAVSPCKLDVTIRYRGIARANTPYLLYLHDEKDPVSGGNTDGNGRVECPIPPRARWGRLYVGTDKGKKDDKPPEVRRRKADEGPSKDPSTFPLEEFLLYFGHLPPKTETSGVRARLANLGLVPVWDGQDDWTGAALEEFAEIEGKTPTIAEQQPPEEARDFIVISEGISNGLAETHKS